MTVLMLMVVFRNSVHNCTHNRKHASVSFRLLRIIKIFSNGSIPMVVSMLMFMVVVMLMFMVSMVFMVVFMFMLMVMVMVLMLSSGPSSLRFL